ncbi:peptidase C39 family protein [Idiomarina seosinensis]|uniref:Ribosomal-protein-alanine acetyltransferase n=1 Tax=Idiomarina seosinensis TaxID=281739 RepID=A0A432ZIX2_9GAMM|nr:peptidase C39 family protein [Idiomarina seosinensis]RUO77889.1 ribosomal-protein-alanine acetyltransferase [Idiomarina seosinensis]
MLTVMPATKLHLDAVVALEKQTFPEDAISRRSFKRFIESVSADFQVALIDDDVVGYFVVLYRNNTNLARLYALVIAPGHRQAGYGQQLLVTAEEAADTRHCLFLRTEIATSNQIAEQLLVKEGFRTIELREAYFPPSHSQSRDALVMQKLLPRYEIGDDSGVGATEEYVPMLTQTTEFTCGPASLLMAMDYFDRPSTDPAAEELEIWREATTIYMTSGHGGCGPHGLARAALKRGLSVTVEVNADGPLFIDSVRQAQKKEVMQRIQEADRTFLMEQGVAINVRDYTTALLKADLANGALVMALISTYSFDGIRAPHWVLICAADDDFVYINDPDYDTLPWESSTQRQYLPIPIGTFNKAFGYGGRKQKAAVVLTEK